MCRDGGVGMNGKWIRNTNFCTESAKNIYLLTFFSLLRYISKCPTESETPNNQTYKNNPRRVI